MTEIADAPVQAAVAQARRPAPVRQPSRLLGFLGFLLATFVFWGAVLFVLDPQPGAAEGASRVAETLPDRLAATIAFIWPALLVSAGLGFAMAVGYFFARKLGFLRGLIVNVLVLGVLMVVGEILAQAAISHAIKAAGPICTERQGFTRSVIAMAGGGARAPHARILKPSGRVAIWSYARLGFVEGPYYGSYYRDSKCGPIIG